MNATFLSKSTWTAAASVTALLFSLATTEAHAVATISLIPAVKSVNVGDSFSVDITTAGATTGIGAWDFVLGYTEPGLLSLTGVSFSDALGNIGTQATSFVGSDFGVVSFLSAADLLVRQAVQPMTLASLTFSALAPGRTQLTLAAPALGELLSDAQGLALPATINRASITITAVPEPSEWLSLFAGLGVVGVLALRRRGAER